MSALDFVKVSKSFGEVQALVDFSISLEQGELVSLLGPSGCGKTTALRIAAGFEIADSGSIHLESTNIIGLPANERKMGMVFQSYSLFPHLNIRDNVAFGLKVRGVRNEERKKRAGEMLDLVRLSDLGHRMPHQISGGQQQRVALARALATQPHVLLLDEPLSALDAKIRVEVRDEIRRLNRDLGVTTVFVIAFV
jgi:putative spermidine/putrescine transport system ATP-binding protein